MAFEDRNSPNSASSPGPSAANGRPSDCETANQCRSDEFYETNKHIKQEAKDYEPATWGIDGSVKNTTNQGRMSVSCEKQTPVEKIHNYTSFSIDRFVHSPPADENQYKTTICVSNTSKQTTNHHQKQINNNRRSNQTSQNDNRSNINQNNDTRMKFSVDDILKPDFGVRYTQKPTDIWNPLKRLVTPIIRASDEVRKPRSHQNRRSFEVARLAEIGSTGTLQGGHDGRLRGSESTSDVVEVQPRAPSASPAASSCSDGDASCKSSTAGGSSSGSELWPAWVYCTRYSDRPSSGPRSRRMKRKEKTSEEKRPRTAFSGDQLSRLKHEFAENRYLTERRRQDLARELGLNEAQIKIWFQNKRAKMKKARGEKNPLALQLMAQGLYNHSTVPVDEEEFLEEMAIGNRSSSIL